ncbi:MAG: hypothetical protein IPJ32_08195 [Sphingobacteriaceae bacterium]|nr:hypothetical protein [Sphingobacteriaceae bacterium]
MDEYFYLCTSNELNAVVDEVFGAIPGSWTISKNLDTRIKAFITNQERSDQIREIITEKINIF